MIHDDKQSVAKSFTSMTPLVTVGQEYFKRKTALSFCYLFPYISKVRQYSRSFSLFLPSLYLPRPSSRHLPCKLVSGLGCVQTTHYTISVPTTGYSSYSPCGGILIPAVPLETVPPFLVQVGPVYPQNQGNTTIFFYGV